MERLRALPEPQRAAIVMRELEGLSHEEIAAALGLTGGGARQTIYRARRSLRDGFGLLIPIPLLHLLLAGGGGAATAGAAAGGAGAAARPRQAGRAPGVGLKAGIASVVVAGSVGDRRGDRPEHRRRPVRSRSIRPEPGRESASAGAPAADSRLSQGATKLRRRRKWAAETVSAARTARREDGDDSGRGRGRGGDDEREDEDRSGPSANSGSGSGDRRSSADDDSSGSGSSGSGSSGSGSGSSGSGSGSGVPARVEAVRDRAARAARAPAATRAARASAAASSKRLRRRTGRAARLRLRRIYLATSQSLPTPMSTSSGGSSS